ncbi:MAG: hypothetical protein RR800_00445 [Comamonas sp.]
MLVDDLAPFGHQAIMQGFTRLRVTYSGQQPITSALLIGACEGAVGRLSPDEAWSLALGARDEAATVVWNDEIEQAWWGAAELMRGARPDQVGARRAFIDTYTNVCHRKRERGELPMVSASLGTDKRMQVEAIRKAHSRGLDVRPLLEGEQGAVIKLSLESCSGGAALLLGRNIEGAADELGRGVAARAMFSDELARLAELFDGLEPDAAGDSATDWEIAARNLHALRGALVELGKKRRPQQKVLAGPELLRQLRDVMASAPAEREKRRDEKALAEREDWTSRKRAADAACAGYKSRQTDRHT